MDSLRFEWENQKAQINFKRHGVSFDEAATIFYDPLHLEYYDEAHSEQEDRLDMLEEYNFSNAKPRRLRGFQGSLIRVLEDGTEQVIESKLENDSLNVERGQRQISLLLDAFVVEYFEAKAGEQGVQALINQVLVDTSVTAIAVSQN